MAGVVSEWRDRSGNGLHLTQNTASRQPTTGVDSQNGLNVLSFDGDDYMQKNPSNLGDYDQTWLVVSEINASGVNNSADGIITYGGWGAGQWHLRANNGSQFRGKIYVDGNSLSTTNLSQTQLLGYQLISISFDRGNNLHSNWLNGIANDSNIVHTTALGSNRYIRIFTGSNSAHSPVGKMAEVVCIKSVATSDRNKVEGYLAHKW